MPSELKAANINSETFKKALAYSADKKQFGMLKAAFDQILNFGLLWYALLPWLWEFAGRSSVTTFLAATVGFPSELALSLVFIFTYSIASSIISIPWDLWYAFVIEERHGFNKLTLTLFFTDMLKSTAVGIVIGTPVLWVIIAVIRWGGPHFYIYAWAAVAVIQLVVMTIFPIFIQPLFNKFTPLPDDCTVGENCLEKDDAGYLKNTGTLKPRIEALAKKVAFPLKKLFMIDGSQRSNHSNAYMYGFSWNKRIVLYDTLMQQTTHEDDVVGIIGHELGHWALGHTTKNLVISQVLIFLNFFAYGFVMNSDKMYTDFGFKFEGEKPVLVGLLLFSMLFSPLDALVSFGMNHLSRKFEYEADAFGKGLGYKEHLCKGLVAIHEKNLGEMNPDPLYSAYHHSHPTIVERLKALRQTGEESSAEAYAARLLKKAA